MTAEEPLIPEKVLRFMNALPVTGDVVEWIMHFRRALQELLGDVDRIACSVNINCLVDGPVKYNPYLHIDLHVRTNPDARILLPCVSHNVAQSISHNFIAQLRRSGHELDCYQEPHGYDYFIGNNAYLGTLILFRTKGRSPISARTLQAMEQLEPFFIGVFSGLVTRQHYVCPATRFFTDKLHRVWSTAGLTWRERQVVALHLMGLSYSQIAGQLFISEHTVAKHVKSAHRKTGCASFLEIFAPYFRTAAGEETPG